MSTNEILPFAVGVGSNVISQSDYSGLAARQTGFQAGTAVSGQVNKAIRQGSFVASMIGQFVADNQSLSVSDDGDVFALERKFEEALKQYLGPNIVHVGLNDGGTANAINMTVSPPLKSYDTPCVVIFRKRPATPNDGAVMVNFGAGNAPLRDSGGADFSSAALLGGSVYIASWDGAQFRVLGGEAHYTSVTELTANSGDGVEVTTGGLVNFRTLRGTHDNTIADADRWPRGDGLDDKVKYLSTVEFKSWLQENVVPKQTPYYVEGTGVQYLSVPARAGQKLVFFGYYDGAEGTYGGWPADYTVGHLFVNVGATQVVSKEIRSHLNWIDIWSAGRANLTANCMCMGSYTASEAGTFNFSIRAANLSSVNYANKVSLLVV